MSGLVAVILLSLSAFFGKHVAHSIKFKGDNCTLDSGAPGTCAVLTACPHAVLLLKENKKPINCGFERYTPIVCCPNNQLAPEKLTYSAGKVSKEVCRKFYPKPEFTFGAFGGKKSLAGEFPHMAILGYSDDSNPQWLCGGSLISEQFVLTAAHCISSKDFDDVRRVRLGDLDIKNTTEDARPQDFNVVQKFIHPEYKSSSRYNDIALVKLDREAKFDAYVRPACLQTDHDVVNGLGRLKATGWGKTDFAGEPSSHMMKVRLSYIDNARCSKFYETVSKEKLERGIEDSTQLCAGDSGGKDTCPGDSGGPLQFQAFTDETTFIHWKIVGVTSFGKSCGIAKDSCGVYTRVSYYVSWIEDTVWPNFV